MIKAPYFDSVESTYEIYGQLKHMDEMDEGINAA